MSRPVYLIVYSSPLFKAHWALWVPEYSSQASGRGKVIHVTGDPRTGFEHQFKRNYDINATDKAHMTVFLGNGDASRILDTPGDGYYTNDTAARDDLEHWALTVPAPGPSLRSSNATGPRQRVVMQNCQTWLRELVIVLINENILDGGALNALDAAPQH